MRPGGVILCESSREETLPETAGEFVRLREYRYGKAKISLYRQPEQPDDTPD